MAELVTDRNDPRLGFGGDTKKVPQNEAYLVLSQEERDKGFVRPVRDAYVHTGPIWEKPKYELRDLTEEEKKRHYNEQYAKFEEYPEGEPALGRYWTKDQLERQPCDTVTTMSRGLAETYARDPKFYGSTYCLSCSMHLPVSEFKWHGTDEIVGS